jgi:hypothetical protein
MSDTLGESAQIRPPLDDDRIPVTVRLKPLFHDYLTQRAKAHDQEPEAHLEAILRSFWRDDRWRQQSTAPVGPGEPAGTSRR